ncbi:MAG: ABC transporter ATP-binding protein [Ferrimicrobium sp.]
MAARSYLVITDRGADGSSRGASGEWAEVPSDRIAEQAASAEPVLDLVKLTLTLNLENGQVRPVDGVSFSIRAGETLCLVGESGSGKSLTALAIMRLIELETHASYGGKISFAGVDILGESQREMTEIRGRRIAMIPQEPMAALNPVLRIGRQLEQVGLYHSRGWRNRRKARREYRSRAEQALVAVGIQDVHEVMRCYPHQLSGGMQQRVMIAMAVIAEPTLIIADEPTTALDVTTQAQILTLIRELQRRTGVALLLITHDLAVAAQVADRIAVMYAGQIVEQASVEEFYSAPVHPYAVGLLGSIPSIDNLQRSRLNSIPGSVPPLNALPPACRFAPRCSYATEICREKTPELRDLNAGLGHVVACWHPVVKI